MKVVVASFPKCGTKTLHACLERLGYSVYDFDLNFARLEAEWSKIFKYGTKPGQMRKMFENVDATCDLPACYYWEELHREFPDAKIILTMRKSEEEWERSWNKQLDALEGNLSFVLMMNLTWTGLIYDRFYRLMGRVVFGCPEQSPLSFMKQPNRELQKRRYRDHNNAVLQRAPKDKLLVFDFSEGWKPLCDFLGKKVPNEPFPHENSGSTVVDGMMGINPLFVRLQRELYVSLAFMTALFAIALYLVIAFFV